MYQVIVDIYGEEIVILTTDDLEEARRVRDQAGRDNRPTIWCPSLQKQL